MYDLYDWSLWFSLFFCKKTILVLLLCNVLLLMLLVVLVSCLCLVAVVAVIFKYILVCREENFVINILVAFFFIKYCKKLSLAKGPGKVRRLYLICYGFTGLASQRHYMEEQAPLNLPYGPCSECDILLPS